MSPPESDPPPINPAEPRPIDFAELRRPVVRQVGQLMAAAAMTAPKSGGQLLAAGSPGFLETVLVEDPATLTRLAEWMRARGAERREAIWFRDADAAQGLDGVLFIGLVNPYPPTTIAAPAATPPARSSCTPPNTNARTLPSWNSPAPTAPCAASTSASPCPCP